MKIVLIGFLFVSLLKSADFADKRYQQVCEFKKNYGVGTFKSDSVKIKSVKIKGRTKWSFKRLHMLK